MVQKTGENSEMPPEEAPDRPGIRRAAEPTIGKNLPILWLIMIACKQDDENVFTQPNRNTPKAALMDERGESVQEP